MSVEIYSNGIVSCSVCAPTTMSREDVEVEVNARNPSGIRSSWSISKDEKFATGETNPAPCDDSDARVHYLMEC